MGKSRGCSPFVVDNQSQRRSASTIPIDVCGAGNLYSSHSANALRNAFERRCVFQEEFIVCTLQLMEMQELLASCRLNQKCVEHKLLKAKRVNRVMRAQYCDNEFRLKYLYDLSVLNNGVSLANTTKKKAPVKIVFEPAQPPRRCARTPLKNLNTVSLSRALEQLEAEGRSSLAPERSKNVTKIIVGKPSTRSDKKVTTLRPCSSALVTGLTAGLAKLENTLTDRWQGLDDGATESQDIVFNELENERKQRTRTFELIDELMIGCNESETVAEKHKEKVKQLNQAVNRVKGEADRVRLLASEKARQDSVSEAQARQDAEEKHTQVVRSLQREINELKEDSKFEKEKILKIIDDRNKTYRQLNEELECERTTLRRTRDRLQHQRDGVESDIRLLKQQLYTLEKRLYFSNAMRESLSVIAHHARYTLVPSKDDRPSTRASQILIPKYPKDRNELQNRYG